jgi:hypothetical protein
MTNRCSIICVDYTGIKTGVREPFPGLSLVHRHRPAKDMIL